MAQNIFISASLLLFSGFFTFAFGQTSDVSLKPSVVTGDVVSISQKTIVVNSKTGVIDALLSDKTQFKRVSPETPSLKTATPSVFADIAVGDRVIVTGILAADAKSLPARSVYLMTKSDISQKQAKESEEWKTRGITGRVTAVNPQTNQITVEMRSLIGSSSIALTPRERVKFLRYAPDSVQFNEAKESSLAEIKQGDMIRALGDKSTDGATFTAEIILTGAFQTVAGTVKTIDPAKGEVLIKNLQTGKDVTILVGAASVLKKFPAEMAERMAGFQGGGGARPAGAPAPGGQSPGGARPGFGGARVGGIDEMLERFPNITVADLKAGDMIAISSTKNGNLDRIKAIKLLAGVEPFLRLAQAAGSAGGGRGQGVQGGFTIPGLDGVSFP